MLCNQYGDEDEHDAGRILSAGVNEWVHVNCALWSAEVYESDSGLLQNVHTALARGQKLVRLVEFLQPFIELDKKFVEFNVDFV